MKEFSKQNCRSCNWRKLSWEESGGWGDWWLYEDRGWMGWANRSLSQKSPVCRQAWGEREEVENHWELEGIVSA